MSQILLGYQRNLYFFAVAPMVGSSIKQESFFIPQVERIEEHFCFHSRPEKQNTRIHHFFLFPCPRSFRVTGANDMQTRLRDFFNPVLTLLVRKDYHLSYPKREKLSKTS